MSLKRAEEMFYFAVTFIKKKLIFINITYLQRQKKYLIL